jgi:branched-chain amino acid transport system permease protein
VLNATGAVNFAQGDLVMTGGYAAILLAGVLPVPGILLLPVVLVLMAVLGLAFSALAYFPLRARPPATVIISTIALGIVLQNGVNLFFGAAPRAAPPLFAGGTVTRGGVVVARHSLAILAVAALIVLGQ